jgi:hypothetical protein
MTLQTHEEEEMLAKVRALDTKISKLEGLVAEVLAEIRKPTQAEAPTVAEPRASEPAPTTGGAHWSPKKKRWVENLDEPAEPSPLSAAAEPVPPVPTESPTPNP